MVHIEGKKGWASEENSMYGVLENGELARRRTIRVIKPKQAALDSEHATGEKSVQRTAQEYGYQTKVLVLPQKNEQNLTPCPVPGLSFLWGKGRDGILRRPRVHHEKVVQKAVGV